MIFTRLRSSSALQFRFADVPETFPHSTCSFTSLPSKKFGNKISSRLGVLRRARKVLPKPTCLMLYNTIVLPLFDYCSPVWDSCGAGCKDYLDKLNRRAACIIEGRSVGAEKLKSALGWPNLQARKNYHKCLLVHKCLHEIASSYLLSEFRHAHLYHGYNTRSRDLLRPPFAKTAKYQGSFRIMALELTTPSREPLDR